MRTGFRGALTLVCLVVSMGYAQESELDLSTRYQRGIEALERGDYEAYVHHFERAVELVPEDDLNRPFVMYHLARAHALAGNADAAGHWLKTILEERIESLMVYYVTLDPAFEAVRDSQPIRQAMERMRKVEVDIEPVQGRVYILRGAGSNLLASIGGDGSLLVDAGYAPAAPAIQRALGTHGSGPLRLLVNTHHHEDHTGGNGLLGAGATVIAHPATRKALQQPWEFIPGVEVPSRSGPALPRLTAEEPLSIHLNGEEIRLIPLPGHTEGDIIVHFTASRVVHMGDRFFPGATRHIYPGPDPDSYVATMNSLLADLPPDTRVIAGHGPLRSVDALRAAHSTTVEAIDWIRQGIATGRPLKNLQAEGASRDLSPGWIAGVYRALSKDG